MRRLWPTAERACRVARSLARAPDRRTSRIPRAGWPAAMAPELTTMTLWPDSRTAATSAHSLVTAPSSTCPPASVTEDEPILATTITELRSWRPRRPGRGPIPALLRRGGGASPAAGCPSRIRLVGEREGTHAHHVTLAGAGAGESPIYPQPVQTVLDVVEGLGVGQVAHGHRPLGGPTTNDEPSVVGPLDVDALGLGAVDHDRLERCLGGPGLLHQLAQSGDEGPEPGAGHRRDPRCRLPVRP